MRYPICWAHRHNTSETCIHNHKCFCLSARTLRRCYLILWPWRRCLLATHVGFTHNIHSRCHPGRDFNALWRAHVVLHVTRRVVAPKSNTGTGRIARRKALASMVAFRFSLASGSRTSALNENPSGLKCPTLSWLGPLQVSAPGVAHSSSWTLGGKLGACTRGVENSKFSKILTLVRGSAF